MFFQFRSKMEWRDASFGEKWLVLVSEIGPNVFIGWFESRYFWF